MAQFALIQLLEDLKQPWTASNLPLHLSVVLPFSGIIEKDIIKRLSQLTSTSPTIELHKLSRKNFGLKLATEYSTSDNLRKLRRIINKSLGNVVFDEPQFSGLKYCAHVTDQENRSFVSNKLIVEELTLVKIEDGSVSPVYTLKLRPSISE